MKISFICESEAAGDISVSTDEENSKVVISQGLSRDDVVWIGCRAQLAELQEALDKVNLPEAWGDG